MRRILILVAVAWFVAAGAAPSRAQVVARDAYQVSYFSNYALFDRVWIINTGQVGSPIDAATKQGTVCADIYVFDANQEMMTCCSCPITANGLLIEDGPGLTFPALTGFPPADRGVIKIVADAVTACDPRTITSPIDGGLRAFGTHFSGTVVCTTGGCGFSGSGQTETEFQRAPLTQAEQSFLGNACSFVLYLGSGRGRCACGPVG